MTTIFKFVGGIFIPHPFVALIPAIVLGILYFQSKSRLILTTAVLWALYVVYEELHLLRIVCSGECNIRIDLLVIYPVFIITTLISLGIVIKNYSKSL